MPLLYVFPGRSARHRKRTDRYRREREVLFSLSEPDDNEAERDSDDRAHLMEARGEFSKDLRKNREG